MYTGTFLGTPPENRENKESSEERSLFSWFLKPDDCWGGKADLKMHYYVLRQNKTHFKSLLGASVEFACPPRVCLGSPASSHRVMHVGDGWIIKAKSRWPSLWRSAWMCLFVLSGPTSWSPVPDVPFVFSESPVQMAHSSHPYCSVLAKFATNVSFWMEPELLPGFPSSLC